MSEVKVNKISPRSGTAITLGDSGDTFTIPSGATLAIAGSVTGFTSAGIDDNATSVAITIDSSERVGIGITSPLDQLSVLSTGIGRVRFAPASGSVSNLLLSGVTTGDSGFQFNSNQLNMFSYGDIAFYPSTSNISGSYPNGEVMRIRNTGNVGIGTSSPSQKLHVYSTANQIARFETSVTEGQLSLKDLTGEAILKFRNDYRFTNSTGELVRIDSSGNVGIGETAPLGQLHVKSADSGVSSVDGGANELIVENSSDAGITIASGSTSFGKILFADSSNNADGQILYDQSGRSLRFSTAGAEAIRIDSSGRVGIGLSNPVENLQISDTASNKPQIRLETSDGGNKRLDLYVDGSIGTIAADQSSQSLAFRTSNSERMRIDSSGNVGIGTASPSGKLDVAGTIIGDGLQIDGDAVIQKSSGDVSLTIAANENGSNREPSLNLKGANSSSNPIIQYGDSTSYTGSIQYENADKSMQFGTNSSERMRIHSNGVISSVNGIALGVGTASTASNVLDDYEEGSWTPNIGGNASYSAQAGFYRKIGKMVFANFQIQINVKGTGNASRLQGLPFNSTANVALNVQSGYTSYFANLAINVNSLAFYVERNATTAEFVATTSTTATTANGAAVFGNGAHIYGAVVYATDA